MNFLLASIMDNASWCDAVCRAHGITGEFGAQAWKSACRTPRYYPHAVTVDPAAAPADVLSGIDVSEGCSVKDSFATLDLSGFGFSVLFEAQWIRCPSGPPVPGWRRASSTDFPAALLADRSVAVLARGDDRVVAHRGPGVAGLCNFAADDPDDAWPGAVAAVSAAFPGVPVVGYEHGDALERALRHGAEPLGPLRVWFRAE